MTTLLGAALRRARKNKCLTLKDIEEITGINNAYLSQLETGRIAKPRLSILDQLSPIYGLALEDLLSLSGQVPRRGPVPTISQSLIPGFILDATKVFDESDWEILHPIVDLILSTKASHFLKEQE